MNVEKNDIFFEKKVLFSSFFGYVCYFYYEGLRELDVKKIAPFQALLVLN